jgi:hypothetical protein
MGVFSVSRFYHAAKFGLGTFLTSVVGPLYLLLLLLVPNKAGVQPGIIAFFFLWQQASTPRRSIGSYLPNSDLGGNLQAFYVSR